MIQPYGPSNARIMIVQGAPTWEDIRANKPLQGPAGRELGRILSEAGGNIMPCFITSFIRRQVRSNSISTQVAQRKSDITPDHFPFREKMVTSEYLSSVDALNRDIDLVKPKIIVVFDNEVLYALVGKWGIKSWRSSIMEYTTPEGHSCIVMATYSPSYVQAVWKERSVVVNDFRKILSIAALDDLPKPPDYNFIVRPSFGVAAKTLQMLLKLVEAGPTKLSVDIETRGGHTACTGIAWTKTDAICIPHIVVDEKLHYWLVEEEAFLMHLMYRLLTHPNAEVIGQNFIYDAQYFYRHFHFIPNLTRDTMIAQHSMFSNQPKGLDFLASIHCEHHIYWKDESKNWNPKLGEDQLWIYNCKDCCVTYEVDESQQAALAKFLPVWPELQEVHDFQQSLFYPVLATMIRGLRVDNSSKSALSDKLAAAIAGRNSELEYIIGYPINIRSPKQMQDLFYRQLNQTPIKQRMGGVTTNDQALTKLGNREPLLLPITKRISDLRSLNVFRSTFLEAPVDIDDRMRCSFNIAGTDTYRFSSSENAFGSGMNLQNVPSGDSDLPNIRELFLADEGMEFFDIDLDSADLRIVVWESDCTEMKAMFAEGLKPYVEVAKEYYRDPTIDKHHPSYKLFKALCHGTNYLGTASGLSGRIGLVTHEVERIQKWYYGKFPQIKTWQEQITNDVVTKRFIQNVFGYRYHFFDRIEGTIFNQAVAWIPQSTVACLINRGYRNIHRNEPDVEVLLQVHDSLAGQYPIDGGETYRNRILSHCAVGLPYPEPLIIPVGLKTSKVSWGACG
jgi:DNA polymerase I-like protein with 3'-5' exonuclease and polymerase domains/uracil-DNA glycosylase